MHVAIYARVSTERQGREQTIESQLTLLRVWAEQHEHHLAPEHIYTDEGYSGSHLDRPGLDRLRDDAQAGQFRILAVLAPDRLARKYAYQVLLIEELRHAGCEVVFLQHPISDDPNDQLLLQIQGAIAEYERALLGERFRRGKLQKARAGQYLSSRAPYGYRYIPSSVRHAQHPGRNADGPGPNGAKGCGEGGLAAVIAAIATAVVDAGVPVQELPLTPERVWRLHQTSSGVGR